MCAELSSIESCRWSVDWLRRGAACGCPVESALTGGGGADRLVAERLKPVGIEGAGRDGRILPFSEVGVAGVCDCSDIIDTLSTFESSE